eukprot:GHVT01041893.1.p1 GENE.GHVT01041893.1~~GHVT01041893.1.p1  ORF type:complete len:153 (+),score=10.60 GHVT01041893.1:162-620(+)
MFLLTLMVIVLPLLRSLLVLLLLALLGDGPPSVYNKFPLMSNQKLLGRYLFEPAVGAAKFSKFFSAAPVRENELYIHSSGFWPVFVFPICLSSRPRMPWMAEGTFLKSRAGNGPVVSVRFGDAPPPPANYYRSFAVDRPAPNSHGFFDFYFL